MLKNNLSVSANGSIIVSSHNDTDPSESSYRAPQIQSLYKVVEDDLLWKDNILMCPIIFGSQETTNYVQFHSK